ncbi:MAG: tetratricopeptide repeat protein [Hymenobacter sp.]|nr:MAG: tetratricopeptide repeat protein [Hymenobacter sp.]
MSFKPWKPLLLTAVTLGAGATAATAQDIAAAQKAIELERYNEARGLLRNASSPEANYELGRLYQMRDLDDSAATYFNKAAGATPFGQVAAGRAALAKGQNDAAATSFDAAVKATKSKDAKVLTMIAQAYYEKGVLDVRSRNAKDAITNLEKAISLDSKYAPAYKELAEMYYYAGQYDKALSTFKQYQDVAEKSTNTDAEYASFLYLTKKYPEALTEVNSVLAKEPNNVTMNRLKAYTLFETKDYAGAATAIDNYMRVTPAEKIIPDDYVYQGKILSKAGRTDEALVVLNKALTIASPSQKPGVEAELAQVYLDKKDYPNAVVLMSKQAQNGDLADQYRLGATLITAKMYSRADSVFNIINTAKPTYGPAYLARAQANFGLDPESTKGLAKPYYEKYIELSKAEGADPARFRSGLITSNNYLGYYNLQKGDRTTAKTYYQQVLAIDPTNADATNALKIINGVPAKATPARKPAPKK